jgi:hypothetical protein
MAILCKIAMGKWDDISGTNIIDILCTVFKCKLHYEGH